MKNITNGTTFSSFAELATAMGFKSRKTDESKLNTQREKFCKCYKCKGTMQLVRGSNVLVCNSVLTDSKGIEIKNKDGSLKTCSHTRYLDAKGISYAEYLFA